MLTYFNGNSWVPTGSGYGYGPGVYASNNSGGGFDGDGFMAAFIVKILLDKDALLINTQVKARLDYIGEFLDAFKISWDTDQTTPIAVTGSYADQKFT